MTKDEFDRVKVEEAEIYAAFLRDGSDGTEPPLHPDSVITVIHIGLFEAYRKGWKSREALL